MYDTAIAQPASAAGPYGPWGRALPEQEDGLSAAVLDEIDYGVILVSRTLRVGHCNHTARLEMRTRQLLRMEHDVLRVEEPRDGQRLLAAVQAAADRRMRNLVTLGGPEAPLSVSVVPLGRSAPEHGPLVLLVLGKRDICARLSADRFASDHGLTTAEAMVLGALSEGFEPRQIAQMNGVSLTTIRTQIHSVRGKTGVRCIRELMLRVAMLPPLVNALRS